MLGLKTWLNRVQRVEVDYVNDSVPTVSVASLPDGGGYGRKRRGSGSGSSTASMQSLRRGDEDDYMNV